MNMCVGMEFFMYVCVHVWRCMYVNEFCPAFYSDNHTLEISVIYVVCMYVYVYMCMYVYVYVHVYV